MKIKKLLSAIIAAAILPVTVFAASASNTVSVKEINLETNKIVIEGTLESSKAEDVLLIVSGKALANISGNADVSCQERKKSEADGSFTFEFVMAGNSGSYNVFVQAKSLATPMQTSFYFADTSEKDEIIRAVNEDAVATLASNLASYRAALGLNDFIPFGDADMLEVAEFLKGKAPFAAGAYSLVQEAAQEASILSCLNNSKADSNFIDESKNFINADLIGLTSYETSNIADGNKNFYSLYKTLLSDTGKANVLSALKGKSLTSYADIRNAFAESVLANAILNTEDTGGGDHISNVLTSANAAELNALAYILTGEAKSALSTAISNYLANSANQSKINTELLKLTSCNDASELASGIATAITNAGSGGSTVVVNPTGTTGTQNSPGGVSGPSASTASDSNASSSNIEQEIFSDVPKTHWANEPIEALYRQGVVNGYPDGTYKPNGAIKREEAVKMLCVAFDSNNNYAEINFSDVSAGAWYVEYIKAGVGSGFVKGITTSRFGIGSNISRQDLAVMLYRIMGEPSVEGTLTFADADTVAGYARNAVIYMTDCGIFNGYPDNTIRANNPVSRAEAAKMIYNCIKGGF